MSEAAVVPVEELRIADTKRFLLGQSKTGKLKILYYPDRIPEIPDDDEDLVYRGIIWTRAMGDHILENFQRYHPHLIPRIQKGLEENRYMDDDFYRSS